MKNINQVIYPFKDHSDVLVLPASSMFKNQGDKNFIGEIFINYDQAKKAAENYHHSLLRELSFLLLHGLLHLLNYDHKFENDKKLMFGLTNEILEKLSINRHLKNNLDKDLQI